MRPRSRRFALARRREVWWPTWQGLLLATALAFGLAVLAGLSIYSFLAPVAPVAGARTLVVEGWVDPPALRRAAELARTGRYERVLTTGGPIDAWMDRDGWGSFAARAARLLEAEDRRVGVPVIALPAPESAQERTFESALAVRDWVVRSGLRVDALDVFTADVHARRSRLLYRLAFGDATRIGVLADHGDDPGARRWWTTSASAKRVLGEAIAWAWTECCFWPDPPAVFAPP